MCSEESSQNGEGSELLGDMHCPEKPGISSDISPGSGSMAFSGRVTPQHRTRIRAGTQGVELTEIQASVQGPGYRGWAASPGCVALTPPHPTPPPGQRWQRLGPASGRQQHKFRRPDDPQVCPFSLGAFEVALRSGAFRAQRERTSRTK